MCSVMSVVIENVRPEDTHAAFQWHRGFAASNQHLLPRTWDHYEALANDFQVVVAHEHGDYLGQCYYTQNQDTREWEIGGLMVAGTEQGRGVGSALFSVAVGNLLIDIDPLDIGEFVITHVIQGNAAPRGIIGGMLQFAFRREQIEPGSVLPGLQTQSDGNVHADEFELAVPQTLLALATWCNKPHGHLEIVLRDGLTLAQWAEAFNEMAGLYAPTHASCPTCSALARLDEESSVACVKCA